MQTLNQENIPMVGLEIRSINGQDALFTTDGRMLANQCENGHFYYVRDESGKRIKTFRIAFVVDQRGVSTKGPYEPAP